MYVQTHLCSALCSAVPWRLVCAEPVALWKSSLSLTFIILRLFCKAPQAASSAQAGPTVQREWNTWKELGKVLSAGSNQMALHLACRKHRDVPWLYQLVTLIPVWNSLEGAQPCAELSPWASLRLAAAVHRGAELQSHPQFLAEVCGPLIHRSLINNTLNLKVICISKALIFKKDVLHFLCGWEGGWLSSRSWQAVTST